ncbi:MAG: PepSY domain-containing protein [Cyanobacteria bacterium P01_F01_bin.86]
MIELGDRTVNFRKLHAATAPFVLLPLLITVFTGVIYRLGKSWLGLTRDQVHFLMVIHEGEYFGHTLEPIYVLLNGLGLLWMLITGGMMAYRNVMHSHWWRSWQNKPSQE